MPRIEPANVQGLVFQLYRYPISRHLLFRVKNPVAARAFLRGLLPRVTHAAIDLSQRPEPLINVGVTWTGLSALGVVGSVGSLDSAVSAFPDEFRNPPAVALGDWNHQFQSPDVHLVVHLHCMTQAVLDEQTGMLRDQAAAGLAELAPVLTMMSVRLPGACSEAVACTLDL
jgi:hypothetical protein